jgi:hypothetical protein
MHDRLMDVLFPTLIAVCFNHARNTELLLQSISPSLLADYLQRALAGDFKNIDSRKALAVRFDATQWAAARAYFSQPKPI